MIVLTPPERIAPDAAVIVDMAGDWGPRDVRIAWCDEPEAPCPALDAVVAATWERWVEDARRRGAMLFNGRLVRYLRHRFRGAGLEIDVAGTDYRRFIGTNIGSAARVVEFGWHRFANPIGTSAVLIAADGQTLFGRRNHRVAYHPGCVHTFGGAIEAGERGPDGRFDAFESIRRELREELHLEESEIRNLRLIGVLRDRTLLQPELIFEATTTRTSDELATRIRPDHDTEEHAGLVACPDDPTAVAAFLRAETSITPVALGALCLHGRHAWGADWYRGACRDYRIVEGEGSAAG